MFIYKKTYVYVLKIEQKKGQRSTKYGRILAYN